MLKQITRVRAFTGLAILGFVCLAGQGAALGQFTQNRDMVKLDASSFPIEIGKGYRLFKVKCSGCHGLDISLKTNMSPERWTAEVKRMQAMASSRINDAQAKTITDFLIFDEANRKPPITQPASADGPETAPAGRALYYAQGCDACHSIGGKGGAGGPPMGDVGTRLSSDQLMQRMHDRRAGTVMPPLPTDTTDQQIRQLVDFLLTLKGKQ